MDKDRIKEIIYIVISILLAILGVKFFIWLLPIVLIIIIAIIIYNTIRINKYKKAKKVRPIKVIHDDEKNNDK